MNKSFLWGAVFGVAGTYLFHRFVKPMKSNAS